MFVKKMKLQYLNVGSNYKAPNRDKIEIYREYAINHTIGQLLDVNPIIVNDLGELVDGYCTYLLAREMLGDDIPAKVYITNEKVTKVVTGMIMNGHGELYKKNYSWTYELWDAVVPGDMVLAQVKDNKIRVLVLHVKAVEHSQVQATKSVVKRLGKILDEYRNSNVAIDDRCSEIEEEIAKLKFSKQCRSYSDNYLKNLISEIYYDGLRDGYELAKKRLELFDGFPSSLGGEYFFEHKANIQKTLKLIEEYEKIKK